VARQAVQAYRGGAAAPVWLAVLVGIAVLGVTDSLVDVPRVATLIFMVLFAALCKPPLFPVVIR
jgi:hypothetical protein